MTASAFHHLATFIQGKMSMSHIYQPVMLMTLLAHQGKADKETIAKAFLSYDQSQIDYYASIVSAMPGRVLKGHGLVSPGPRGSGEFSLNRFEELSPTEVENLIGLCQAKLDDYIEKRGARIWAHRDHTRGDIPGSIRYEVLKRAQHRCELCGIHEENRALEIDHIIPKSLGGPDTLDNYQALCYKCNANKGNRDNTDFREWKDQYSHRQKGCLFCEHEGKITVLAENELALCLKDNFPISPGHCLIIPKRHVATYFEMNQAELNACNRLILEMKAHIEQDDPTVSGFNIGNNAGGCAGQTVFHAHIHLIPRRKGDQENPRGGVRKIFPEKSDY